MVTMLVDGQPALEIESKTVGARLRIFSYIPAEVTAVRFEQRKFCIRSSVFVNRIGVGVAEEQITRSAPNRAFGELKTLGELEELRVWRHDLVNGAIEADNFDVHFVRRDGDGPGGNFVKLQPRIFYIDIIRRRVRQRTIDAENRQLDCLSRLDAAADDKPVLRVPALDDRAAALSGGARNLTINPYFGVIVERGREDQSRSGRIERADPFRDGDLDTVPAEGELARGAAFIEDGWIDHFPFGIVEIGAPCMRREVIRFVRYRPGLAIRAGSVEIDFNDFRVTVSPLALNDLRAFFRRQIERCLGFAFGEDFFQGSRACECGSE